MKYFPDELCQGTDIYLVRGIDSLTKPTIRESPFNNEKNSQKKQM